MKCRKLFGKRSRWLLLVQGVIGQEDVRSSMFVDVVILICQQKLSQGRKMYVPLLAWALEWEENLTFQILIALPLLQLLHSDTTPSVSAWGINPHCYCHHQSVLEASIHTATVVIGPSTGSALTQSSIEIYAVSLKLLALKKSAFLALKAVILRSTSRIQEIKLIP